MAAGEAWTFDNWRLHRVHNGSEAIRVHLVIDTVGSGSLWRMLKNQAWKPEVGDTTPPDSFLKECIEYSPKAVNRLNFESYNIGGVLPAAEISLVIDNCIDDLAFEESESSEHEGWNIEQEREALILQLEEFKFDWRALWSEYGADDSMVGKYNLLLDDLLNYVEHRPIRPMLKTIEVSLLAVLHSQIKNTLLQLDFGPEYIPARIVEPISGRVFNGNIVFDMPVFIVSAPRCGSTLLFETLVQNQGFWSFGD